MNRPIKFRAWCYKTKQMVYNIHELYDCFGDFINSKGEELDIYETKLAENSFGRLLNRKEIPMMQFTGLMDKNGKEIYEGDILNFINIYCVTEWDQDDARWKFKNGESFGVFKTFLRLSEIVGNIHENPELLNAK